MAEVKEKEAAAAAAAGSKQSSSASANLASVRELIDAKPKLKDQLKAACKAISVAFCIAHAYCGAVACRPPAVVQLGHAPN